MFLLSCNPPRLLAQHATESMRPVERVFCRQIRLPAPDILVRHGQQQVARDAGQLPRHDRAKQHQPGDG